MREKIKEFINANRENIISDWKALVNLEGRYNQVENVTKVAQHLEKLFSDAGVNCQLIQTTPEAGPVLVGEIGAGRPGKPVIFSGHYDTVFEKGTFGDEPFRIEGEKAFGPGVLDMKGGIIISLYVIKALESLGYNERPVRICYCGDEEGGPHHSLSAEIIEKTAQGCVAGFNMETGPVAGNLCVGRKYVMTATMTVHGVSAHSGNDYESGRNAVVEAAHKIIAIQNMNDMEKGTHMNPAIVSGGVVPNRIPGEAKLITMGRFKTLDEAYRVQREMKACFEKPDVEGTWIEYTIDEPSMGFEATDSNMALWKFVNDTCTKYSLPAVGHVFLGGGSDAGSIMQAGVPVLCSCGVRGEWNHTDREYAVVESMFERTEMWCNVVMDIDRFKA